MGKKKLLKENESLKKKLETLNKQKKEFENYVFDEKIKLVENTLKSLGELDFQIDYERLGFNPAIVTKRIFSFVLTVK